MRSEITTERQDQLLTTLEQLLELPVSDISSTLDQVAQQCVEVLAADKMDIFFLDSTNETLVARSVSDTPMGKRQKAIGMDRLPLANGGRIVEVFLTGTPYFSNHVSEDADELIGIKVGLGVNSQIAVVFRVQTRHRGVVLAASATSDFFSPQDLRFVEAVARWIGIVVGRAELAERMRSEQVARDRRRVSEELLTIMAHDLRNYITPLRGRLDLLEEHARREGRERDVQNAESSIHTLNLLAQGISDLLDIARLNQGLFVINPQPMNLIDVVQEVVATFDTKHIPLFVQTPEEVILTADPERLRQSLQNMLAYVVNQEAPQREIIVAVSIERRTDDLWVLLTVKNVGSVLPQQFDSLFQPFIGNSQSTHLGLGLYLTSQIAQAHRGTLTIDSPNDSESCFTFALPIEEEELVVREKNE